jgi:hypothetical protein
MRTRTGHIGSGGYESIRSRSEARQIYSRLSAPDRLQQKCDFDVEMAIDPVQLQGEYDEHRSLEALHRMEYRSGTAYVRAFSKNWLAITDSSLGANNAMLHRGT